MKIPYTDSLVYLALIFRIISIKINSLSIYKISDIFGQFFALESVAHEVAIQQTRLCVGVFMRRLPSSLIIIGLLSVGCSQASELRKKAFSRTEFLRGKVFSLPDGADDSSSSGSPKGGSDGSGAGKPDGSSGGKPGGGSGSPDGADDSGSGNPENPENPGNPGNPNTPNGNPPDGGEGGGTPPIITKPPIFTICWTKANQNNKETVLSSPGISYKIYNYSGQVVSEANTSPSAAAAAKAQLQAEKALTIRVPNKDGNYLLAFCDSSKHSSCSILPSVMSTLGGKQKSFGFRNLRDAPAVIGAIPNMRVSAGKLYAADQPFIIYNAVEDPFCMAAWSPLVLDLAGKGVALSSQVQGVQFDMNGDGTKDQVSWPLKPSSAFLVLDRNNNGNIDSVHELFGNNTVGPDGEKAENGFMALAKYDLNRDGRIDARDQIFKSLRLWGDKNRDGISQEKELTPLDKAGVVAIDLDYVDTFEIDAYGNQSLQRSTVEMKDKKGEPSFKMIFDIWFKI